MRKDYLLIELGTEELPPKSLKSLAASFANNFTNELMQNAIGFNEVMWFATPRRLAIQVSDLHESQADIAIEKRGPALSAAFNDAGEPTKAALGWANGLGISIADAVTLETDKGAWLVYRATQQGQPVRSLLQKMIETSLAKLPIPKPMRWGSSECEFIRPVQNLCVMYGDEVLPVEILGKNSTSYVLGHRFHGERMLPLQHAAAYVDALQTSYVVCDFLQRKSIIRERVTARAESFGLCPDLDDALLEEITSLVEWPVVMDAQFDEEFLSVPKEALVSTMKKDQRYIALFDANGQLSNRFLFVSNIDSVNPSSVIRGNERVIRPRLADAQFFFNTDKQRSLESRLPALESVLFQKDLGSLYDKSVRLSRIAEQIAIRLSADVVLAKRAALLSKADLVSNLVMEFPEVQGIAGKYYATHDGEHNEVALAIEQHYLPKFSGDAVAQAPISIAVALADKLDTLVGIFGIGMLPKGDKDPFALRRAAIGLLRTIIDNSLSLDIDELVRSTVNVYADKLSNVDVVQQVIDFIFARFAHMLSEQGVSAEVLQSVNAVSPTKPLDYVERVKAVSQFSQSDAGPALSSANKRVANILAKQGVSLSDAGDIDESLLVEPAEIALVAAMNSLSARVIQLNEAMSYSESLRLLSSLRDAVDTFFNDVMVMVEDAAIRRNRLAVLCMLRRLFTGVADVSYLG